MRIAVIADTHMPKGGRRLPSRCLDELAAADMIIHLGDFSTVQTLAALEEIGPPVAAVCGNVDEPALRRRLPERAELEVDGARLALIHDAGPRRGRLGRLRRDFPDADTVLFGHSHMPLHERDDDFQIFNPGSPTERRRAPARSMGIAEVAGGRVDLSLLSLA